MQRLTRDESQQLFRPTSVLLGDAAHEAAPAVVRIAENGMSQVLEVDADLVSAAGLQSQVQLSEKSEFLTDRIVGHRAPAVGPHSHLLAVPGASTPGEIVAAWRAGARVVKVFPIGPLGGPDFIRAVRGPLPEIPHLPTNGVGLDQVGEYFDAGVFAVGVGREIFAAGTVEGRQTEAVRERAAAFAAAVESRARGAESAGKR